MARTAGRVWREHGALEYVECAADDVSVGKNDFVPAKCQAQAQRDRRVFRTSFYKSRADRDRVMGKVMKDSRLAKMMDPKKLPFDGKRMFWGGFKTIVEL